ncbi:MAG: TolB family protein [Sporichthyaceae bacterium]
MARPPAAAALGLTLLAGCGSATAQAPAPVAAPAPAKAAAGGVIAFVDRDAGGDEEIFTIRPDGTKRRQLTRNSGLDTEPTVSPDGTRIAWTGEGTPGNVDVFVMNVDGTGKKRLTRHSQPDSDPTFSADGSRIAFRSDRRGGAAEIWTMTVAGKDLRRLTDAGSGPEERQSYQPSFGPAGRIAFTSDRDATAPNGARNEIWTMDCDGASPRRLTDNSVNDSTPSFSPRGDRIAFWSNEAQSNVDVWTVKSDGSDRRRLTTDEGNDLEPAFSPDGARIAFTSTRDGDAKASGDDAVWTMNADGSAQRRLTAGKLPSWGGGIGAGTDLSCEDEKSPASTRKDPESGREVTQDTRFGAV